MKPSKLAYLLYELNRFALAHKAHFERVGKLSGADTAFAVCAFLANQITEFEARPEGTTVEQFCREIGIAGEQREDMVSCAKN